MSPLVTYHLETPDNLRGVDVKTEEEEHRSDAEQPCEMEGLHGEEEKGDGEEEKAGEGEEEKAGEGAESESEYVEDEDVAITPAIHGDAEEPDGPPEHADTMWKETQIPDTIPDPAMQTERRHHLSVRTKVHEHTHQTDAGYHSRSSFAD